LIADHKHVHPNAGAARLAPAQAKPWNGIQTKGRERLGRRRSRVWPASLRQAEAKL